MTSILALFTEYLKPIMISLASLIGIIFISRSADLKAENQMLNDNIKDEDEIIERQNEALQVANNTKPSDINGIANLMQHDKL